MSVQTVPGIAIVEFVQKDPRSNSLIAKARGTIWANVFRLLKPYFEEATGQAFVSGIKVLVQVTVNFHELYGLQPYGAGHRPHLYLRRYGAPPPGNIEAARGRGSAHPEQRTRYALPAATHCRHIFTPRRPVMVISAIS